MICIGYLILHQLLIMFADDTNLFLTHDNVKEMFGIMNNELSNFSEWFKANKLSLNSDKTKFTLFHKPHQHINLPLKLPKLKINDTFIEREKYLKFLGVIIDENLSWRKHISILESKLSRAIGILYKARSYINENSRKLLYFSLIHQSP